MLAVERHKKILELLAEYGAVSVSRLSENFHVTEETVRRDLEKLEKQEQLLRTHGGAVPVSDSAGYDPSLEKRKHTNVDAKQHLAVRAAQFISPGDTIFLDASTTTFYMCQELKKMHNITVITNSVRIINALCDASNIKVIAVGGLISDNQSLVGALAESNIEQHYFAGKMFFSSKGVTKEAGILESNEAECAIKNKMLANAYSKYYLCDSSKVGRVGFVKLAPFSQVDYFITNTSLDEDWQRTLQGEHVNVVEV